MIIFDKEQLKKQLNRSSNKFNDYNFLHQNISENIADRLLDSSREFESILEIGARGGLLKNILTSSKNFIHYYQTNITNSALIGDSLIVADSEILPFKNNSFDLIVSVLDLHFTNDLPGALLQIRKCLKNNGIFIAAIFGGSTITELRQAIIEAEISLGLPCSPHVVPMAETKDITALMQRAGFSGPVVDSFTYKVNYNHAVDLMHDLRYMGQGNLLSSRNKIPLRKEVLPKIEQIYKLKFADDEGGISSSFEIITMTAMGG
jgi:SAM-dependent methyltransferase